MNESEPINTAISIFQEYIYRSTSDIQSLIVHRRRYFLNIDYGSLSSLMQEKKTLSYTRMNIQVDLSILV